MVFGSIPEPFSRAKFESRDSVEMTVQIGGQDRLAGRRQPAAASAELHRQAGRSELVAGWAKGRN